MAPRSNAPVCSDSSSSSSRRGARSTAIIATTVGVAAVVSSALAGPAQAKSPNATWDRVASCESGNNWHTDTGNGFYGGLQFSGSTWRAYHGKKYASRADKATRLEQIEVARRVLSAQGPGAWPVCGPKAGLSRSTGHATHKSLPAVAGTVSQAKPAAKASKHHKKHAGKKAKAHHATYTVRPGDTLSKIAERKHVHGGWKALFHANRAHLSNPNVIHRGQVLTLP
jgi:resuscitation-promoting factor RpfA